jgi:hypothetical protein
VKHLVRDPTLHREQCPLTGMTPLLAVITTTLPQADKIKLVVSFIDAGADLGVRDWQGRCALRLAYPDMELMTLLLDRGARPKPYFFDGSRLTLLSHAASDGQPEIMFLLLKWHHKSGPFFTAAELEALCCAERPMQSTAAELLTESGAKVEAPPTCSEGNTGSQCPVGGSHALCEPVHKVRPQVIKGRVCRHGPLFLICILCCRRWLVAHQAAPSHPTWSLVTRK